jgi:hypothetical protein
MEVIDQPSSGGEVLVVVMASLEIAGGNSLRLRGERPVVFLIEGDASIRGTIDASAEGSVAGPGGSGLCATGEGSAGANASGSASGAGGGSGGGFGSEGGDGGDSSSGSAVTGGATAGTSTLTPLRGGCPGGAGGTGTSVAPGGGGGGAIQLAVAGTLELRGVIVASGGGGQPGNGTSGGGGGGGSGGAILIEAAEVAASPSAVLAANGGGGGGGKSRSSTAPAPVAGADGVAGTATAAGGGSPAADGAGGGGAAVATGPATDGAAGSYSVSGNGYGGGGGGGGGVGRIVLRGAETCAPSGVYSPATTVLCEACGTCPRAPGISCVADEIGDERFYHCSYTLSWSIARSLCQGVGLDLATIGSQEVNDYLVSRLPVGVWFWFGANDSAEEDDWRWSADDSQFWSGNEDGDPVDGAFSAWRSTDPSGTGDCGRLSNAGWDDASCSDSLGFVCGEP